MCEIKNSKFNVKYTGLQNLETCCVIGKDGRYSEAIKRYAL